jgi:hypothetical protein
MDTLGDEIRPRISGFEHRTELILKSRIVYALADPSSHGNIGVCFRL